MERLCQIQFRRRPQRPRPCSGRCADQGGERRADARGQRRSRPTVSPAARWAIGRCANFWRRSSSAPPASSCAADEILITSGSLQALDLVNGILLARGDTVIIEQASYQGSLNRLTRLGVNAVGIPLDGDGMRMDALAAALDDLKRRGVRPKYIYTIPTVQNPTGTILSEARRHELLRLAGEHGVPIFEDDCYADLIWDGKRPPALYAMSKHGGVIHIGSFSKSIAPALRVGYIVAEWAAAVAHAGDQDRRRLRRARADGARRILPGAFRRPCAGADARLARQARNA